MGITNHISFRHWRGDLSGGITAVAIALPVALAFGVASGAGAACGLYGAVIVSLFAALLGGTQTLVSEPTGPMTVVFTLAVLFLVGKTALSGLAPPGGNGSADPGKFYAHRLTRTEALKVSLRRLAAMDGVDSPRIAAEPGMAANQPNS
jgi:MFS superfamily sulfate permease-like transporter